MFLIRPFFLHDQKVLRDKNLNILRTKRAFNMKQKALFKILKGLSMKQITQFFFESRESDFNCHLETV